MKLKINSFFYYVPGFVVKQKPKDRQPFFVKNFHFVTCEKNDQIMVIYICDIILLKNIEAYL